MAARYRTTGAVTNRPFESNRTSDSGCLIVTFGHRPVGQQPSAWANRTADSNHRRVPTRHVPALPVGLMVSPIQPRPVGPLQKLRPPVRPFALASLWLMVLALLGHKKIKKKRGKKEKNQPDQAKPASHHSPVRLGGGGLLAQKSGEAARLERCPEGGERFLGERLFFVHLAKLWPG